MIMIGRLHPLAFRENQLSLRSLLLLAEVRRTYLIPAAHTLTEAKLHVNQILIRSPLVCLWLQHMALGRQLGTSAIS